MPRHPFRSRLAGAALTGALALATTSTLAQDSRINVIRADPAGGYVAAGLAASAGGPRQCLLRLSESLDIIASHCPEGLKRVIDIAPHGPGRYTALTLAAPDPNPTEFQLRHFLVSFDAGLRRLSRRTLLLPENLETHGLLFDGDTPAGLHGQQHIDSVDVRYFEARFAPGQPVRGAARAHRDWSAEALVPFATQPLPAGGYIQVGTVEGDDPEAPSAGAALLSPAFETTLTRRLGVESPKRLSLYGVAVDPRGGFLVTGALDADRVFSSGVLIRLDDDLEITARTLLPAVRGPALLSAAPTPQGGFIIAGSLQPAETSPRRAWLLRVDTDLFVVEQRRFSLPE